GEVPDAAQRHRSSQPKLQSAAPAHPDCGMVWRPRHIDCDLQRYAILERPTTMALEPPRRYPDCPFLPGRIRLQLEHAALEFEVLVSEARVADSQSARRTEAMSLCQFLCAAAPFEILPKSG